MVKVVVLVVLYWCWCLRWGCVLASGSRTAMRGRPWLLLGRARGT